MIKIKYSNSGLNSKRLILNQIIDCTDSMRTSWTKNYTIEVSPEVHFDDVIEWVNKGLITKYFVSKLPNSIAITPKVPSKI